MESAIKIFSVACGGALGATARYGLNLLLAGKFMPFPFATFLINVSGSFLIGFLPVLFNEKIAVGENLSLGVLVGFLGAYTTFSTFELEVFTLVKQRDFFTAFAYSAASFITGFIGVAAGVWLAKRF